MTLVIRDDPPSIQQLLQSVLEVDRQLFTCFNCLSELQLVEDYLEDADSAPTLQILSLSIRTLRRAIFNLQILKLRRLAEFQFALRNHFRRWQAFPPSFVALGARGDRCAWPEQLAGSLRDGLILECMLRPPPQQRSNMEEFAFEQVGSRVKLLETPRMFVCSQEEALAYGAARELRRREEMEQERRRQRHVQKEWQEIQDFLGTRHFKDVNSARSSWWGFKRTYPLHTAVCEGNWRMYQLLVKHGANRQQKDSQGKRACECAVKKALSQFAK
eukprot:s285_g9.t3